MTLDPESAAHPLFATACCSIVAAPKKRASHQSFSLASVLQAASSDLALHLRACCNRQDISNAIGCVPEISAIACAPLLCLFLANWTAEAVPACHNPKTR